MEAFSVADDSFELEAKRKEDSSWHPCRVSLSSSGDGLIVNFESQELEDKLLKKEEVLMHLRYRSMPLQADDCNCIEEGESVLANHKSQYKNLFHDAEVEKVDRIRHSKRGCRCTFMIKWLDKDLEGQTLTVPSSSIRKLATKSISAHPAVRILLKPEKDTGLSYSSPLSSILEATDAEIDFNKLLQKQIELISKLADVSEREVPEDILWRKKNNMTLSVNTVLINEQTPQKPPAESNANVPAVPDCNNHLNRTTRSKTKLQVDIEVKDQSGPNTSMKEEFIQNRSRLSPLASRAALASSLLTAKKCLDLEFSSCMTANMFMKGNHSSEVLAASIPLVSEASPALLPLISIQGDAACKPSSSAPTKVWENENKTSGKNNCDSEDRTFAPAKLISENVNSEVANSTAETMTLELAIASNKSSVHAHFNANSATPVRLTRSAMRKGDVIPNECIQVNICNDDTKRRTSRNKNRLSQSSFCQENKNLASEEESNSTLILESDSSQQNIAILESNVAAPKGKDAESGRSNRGQKRKTVYPKKQERRFSPRNFLPQTRSQFKSQPGKNRRVASRPELTPSLPRLVIQKEKGY